MVFELRIVTTDTRKFRVNVKIGTLSTIDQPIFQAANLPTNQPASLCWSLCSVLCWCELECTQTSHVYCTVGGR